MDLKLHGTFGDYDLFENEGKYYALLSSTVDENAAELISEKKAIEADGLQDLKTNIDEAINGLIQEACLALKMPIKKRDPANSFNTLSEQSHKFDKPKLVIFGGQPYLVENFEVENLSVGYEIAAIFYQRGKSACYL